MLERTDAIKYEFPKPFTFILAYRSVFCFSPGIITLSA